MDGIISKQAAIDALTEMYCKTDEEGYVWIIRGDACLRIDALPSAERVGKWIEVKDKWGGLEIRCSECGAHVPRDEWGNAMQSAYCPNCGATMTEGEEDETD